MSETSHWFWSESVWLPANVSWSDVTNGPGKSVVYPELNDFLYVFPFCVMIFLARYVLERYCFIPLGKSLDITEKLTRKIPYNDKLEAAYLASPKKVDFTNLAKKVNMTERQVARWWRLRTNLAKPSKLVKFCESMWKVVIFTFSFLYGLYVLWDKEWLWDPEKILDGHPHQMYVHHFVAISLLSMSWMSSFYRFGTLVPIMHDCGEILLEAGKALKYARYENACIYTFVVFIIIWILTRIIIFPKTVLECGTDYARTAVMSYILKSLLWMLFSLHIVWTWYIVKVAYVVLKTGEVKGDVRSSDSDEIADSNHCD